MNACKQYFMTFVVCYALVSVSTGRRDCGPCGVIYRVYAGGGYLDKGCGSRGCKGGIALEALLDGKGMGGERRVVRMRCAGWFGHRCTLKTIPNMGYLLYRGTRLQRAAHREGVFHRMVKRKRRTNAKRTST